MQNRIRRALLGMSITFLFLATIATSIATVVSGCAALKTAQSAPVNKTITEVIAEAGAVANSAEKMYDAGTIPQTAAARTVINDLGNGYNLARAAWVAVLNAEAAYNAATSAQISACAPGGSSVTAPAGCTAATANAAAAKSTADTKTAALQTQISALVTKTAAVKTLAGTK